MKGDRNKEIQILPFLSLLDLLGYLPPQENQISIGYGSALSKGEVVGGGARKCLKKLFLHSVPLLF